VKAEEEIMTTLDLSPDRSDPNRSIALRSDTWALLFVNLENASLAIGAVFMQPRDELPISNHSHIQHRYNSSDSSMESDTHGGHRISRWSILR
jgi:hypothetical protein